METKYWEASKDYPTRGEIKEQAKTLLCPKCSAEGMNVRWSKEQPFFGCSDYPNCRGSRNWYAEVGFPEEDWQDTLKAEGKIEPNPTLFKRNQETTHNWKQKFLEERAFVIQQLSDIKAAHTQRLHHCERLEKRIERLEKQIRELQGDSKNEPEDDIPF